MILQSLFYFLNGASLAFFALTAVRTASCARRSESRARALLAAGLAWMVLVQFKNLFVSLLPCSGCAAPVFAYILPDLFALPLLALFCFELTMPGTVDRRCVIRSTAPFAGFAAAYAAGLAFGPRRVYASFGELLDGLPSYLPVVLLVCVGYTVGYSLSAFARIVVRTLRDTRRSAPSHPFAGRIRRHRASALPALAPVAYIGIVLRTVSMPGSLAAQLATLGLWALLYRRTMRCPISAPVCNHEPAEEETPAESDERIAALRRRVDAAIGERRRYLDPGLTIVEMAAECGSNRTHLSQFFNNELGIPFRDYINRYRIEHAIALTTEGTYKAEELALLSGFGSTTTFYRAFAKEKGMPPQQWFERYGKAGRRRENIAVATPPQIRRPAEAPPKEAR